MEEKLRLDFKKIKLRRKETACEKGWEEETFYFKYKKEKYFLVEKNGFLFLKNNDGDLLFMGRELHSLYLHLIDLFF